MKSCDLNTVFHVFGAVDDLDVEARVVHAFSFDHKLVAALEFPFYGLIDYLFNDNVRKYQLLLVKNCEEATQQEPYDFVEVGYFSKFAEDGTYSLIAGDFFDFRLVLHGLSNSGIEINQYYHAIVKNIE